MGNMCCRRVAYSPNGTELDRNRCHQQQQQQEQQQQIKTHTMSNAYHNAGDDCAINELLEGRMDLDVILPDGRQVRLTVERRTPMMDLLVQAASATKISPGSHVIHVFGDSGKGSSALQYKPSTPIGSLDTNTICIVPKKDVQEITLKRAPRIANRPFEPTFRVQVHLPRNQLTVVRVSSKVKISELRSMVCQEKGLETCRYQLVRPSDPTQALAGDLTLAEYGSTEITLLSNSSIESNICNSTSHIIPYSKRVEEQKKKTGILRLLAEDANKKLHVEKKLALNGNNRLAPTNKVEDTHAHQGRYKPKKRRPAPPPPPPVLPEVPFHSRQSSSDSSGYHEATSSYLHEEHCMSTDEKACSDSSGVSSLDAKITATEPPPVPNAKKRKAPPPPPVQAQTIEDHQRWQKEDCRTTQSEICPPVQAHEKPESKSNETPKASLKKTEIQLPVPKETETESYLNQTVLGNNETDESKDERKQFTDAIKEDKLESEQQKLFPTNENRSNCIDIEIKKAEETKVEKKPLVDTLKEKEIQTKASKNVTATECKPNLIVTDGKTTKHTKIEKKPYVETFMEKKVQPESPKKLVAAENSSNHIVIKSKEKKEYKPENRPFLGEPVTRVALVALNAKIEQDVTQQEIASSIQAAFHSLDCPQRIEPSLLAIKQRVCRSDDDRITVTDNDDCSESANEFILPQTPKEEISLHADGTSYNSYPLQKSSAIYTLNLETKDDEEIGVETVLPPPTEFRSDIKEALLIDNESTRSSSPPHSSGSKVLKRSSSAVSVADVTPRYPASKSKYNQNLQRSLSDVSFDDKELEAEQERLQLEYIKLQKQFILWQKQLISNHAMLSEECIVPQYARTLRQSHSLPEGEDYSDEAPSPIPLVSRSLSYEPTRSKCSTLPRSTINIPSLELNSVPIKNGSSTLRSSKNKNYFKPPQVRISTKSRQRLPPEIRKDGELDISDDSKILSTILPSFENLRFISEHKEEEVSSKGSRLQNGPLTVKLENGYNRKLQEEAKPVVQLPNPNKLATFPKPNLKINNGRPVQNGHADANLNCANGDIGLSNRLSASTKVTEHSMSSQPPPPPPLPMQNEKLNEIVTDKSIKFSKPQAKVIKKEIQPQSDPREQLMQEIRKFGGRTALRKISLAS